MERPRSGAEGRRGILRLVWVAFAPQTGGGHADARHRAPSRLLPPVARGHVMGGGFLAGKVVEMAAGSPDRENRTEPSLHDIVGNLSIRVYELETQLRMALVEMRGYCDAAGGSLDRCRVIEQRIKKIIESQRG